MTKKYEAEVLDPFIVRNFIAAAIQPGDEVRLDLKTRGRMGMNMHHHGAWVYVHSVEFDPHKDGFSYTYTCRGVVGSPAFPNYVFHEQHIDGWRRPAREHS